MITVYKCEKCGRTFENFADCFEHERAHLEPETIHGYELPEDMRGAAMEYAGNFAAPVVVYLKSYTYNDDGHRVYSVHRYKLAPDDGTGKELAEALNTKKED